MDSTQTNTEEKILSAAKSVFHRRGFEGARMQEIADEAGVNKALLHYYYRNKETLFEAVFEDAFARLVARVNEIFSSNRPLRDRIEEFTGYYLGFLSENSYLPIFILNSLYTRPEQLRTLFEKKGFFPRKMVENIRAEIESDTSHTMNPMHLMINIISLCIFPAVARPLIESLMGLTPEQSAVFYSERQQVVPEFIINALKNYAPQPSPQP